ncbi:MAG: DUF1643 domain-containing protein [Bacteroidota bacterium]
MDEITWIYQNNAANTVRYVLGQKAYKMIACIGINPSTAKPDDLDSTIKAVKNISEFNGFHGWAMYNVYPQRATDPDDLDQKMDPNLLLSNIKLIGESIHYLEIDTIWVAYGDLIESREYLPFCMSTLYDSLDSLNLNWKIIGNPTQKGHPRHPLYKKTESPFLDFDMEKYVVEKLKSHTKTFELTTV